MPINKLLIANRGEIAVRIAQSAAAAGVQSASIFSADDLDCAHVFKTDESFEIPGIGPEAYLDADAIIGTALEHGYDAIHPGYGFLSESAFFALACDEVGITFVGPSAETLELFGDKANARRHAQKLGLGVIPGTYRATTFEEAKAFLDSLDGGAMIIKAVAGGGGRGMQEVREPYELESAFERCSSEAHSTFGNGDIYVEELIEGARHIEVQLVGDGTGRVSHLWDRDCSVQRRHQKLIESAPSLGLAPQIRHEMFDHALRLGRSTSYRGVGTVEFLISGNEIYFVEVNPRLQAEHTVTEEVTGVDLVEVQLALANGATLSSLGLRANQVPSPRGLSIQARINAETLGENGSPRKDSGAISRFQAPQGRGIRIDTHAYVGYRINPRYDSLVAKLITTELSGEPGRAAAKMSRALDEFDIAGVETNLDLLAAIVACEEFAASEITTDFVETHLVKLRASTQRRGLVPEPQDSEVPSWDPAEAAPEVPIGALPVISPLRGVVAEVQKAVGDSISVGSVLVVIESMKMEHAVLADISGVLHQITVEPGSQVSEGTVIAYVVESEVVDDEAAILHSIDGDHIRSDLGEAIERHRIGLDEGRAASTERRHLTGRRTARENIEDLCDHGSFVEYGALAIAAQRRRRSLEDLIENTPADGLVTGLGAIDGVRSLVMSYDYTVLAGTQGMANHRKKDRMFEIAAENSLPVVIFAEGGGGRPGDTDTYAVAGLDVSSFRLLAKLSGQVPTVAVVSGYCFAGNAALAGCCDVIIATREASLGMGGPAMIEGGGLGKVAPRDVGPMSVQVPNGVVDILVENDEQAVTAVKKYLSYFTGGRASSAGSDQRALRHLIPENRLRVYDIRPIIEILTDTDSVLELRPEFGVGIVTALARIEGKAVGIVANNPRHLGGAIDAEAADKAARFMQLCSAHGLAIISLCDTPGFMVGPEAEKTATVRHFSRMFLAGANLRVPIVAVVLRKSYGLGAMAMAGGSTKTPLFTAAWPSGEFGGMGLEGAVRLGYRRELDQIEDPEARKRRYLELVDQMYEKGKALSAATAFEIDDVIDPAETRAILVRTLAAAKDPSATELRPGYVDSW